MTGRLFALACVLAAALASVVLTLVRRDHLVDPADLDAAAQTIRRDFREGDLVVSVPFHQMGPRQRLGDLAFIEPRRVHADELRRHRRIWLLDLDVVGRRRDLVEGIAALGSVSSRERWGNVELSSIDVSSPERSIFDLRRDLEDVRVTARYPDGEVVSCDGRRREGWSCPRDPGWSWVGRTTVTVDEGPRACVWMHPIHGGGTLWLTTPKLARAGTPIVGHGFTMTGARLAKAAVSVRLLAGDTVIYEQRNPVEAAWTARRLGAVGAGAELRLELSTPNNDAAHFCVDLHVVEPDAP